MHPDIEKVGITSRHATFFEMLETFLLAIILKRKLSWAWELITQGYKLPEGHIYVSIYEQDDEAFYIWRDKIGLPNRGFSAWARRQLLGNWARSLRSLFEIYYDMGLNTAGRPGYE